MADANDTAERWLPAPGYEGQYSISSLGRLRRELPGRGTCVGRIQTPQRKNGYVTYVLPHPFGQKIRYAHHLVALAFLGPRPDGYDIDHVNGDKADARPCNLEYVTVSQNVKRAYDSGRHRPSRHRSDEGWNTSRKLSRDDVAVIRSRVAAGETQTAVAVDFGIRQTQVSRIVNGLCWR